MTPSGSFHGIEARHLGEQRTIDVDAELIDDVRGVLRDSAMFFGISGSIAGGQTTCERQVGVRHVFAHVEDRRVVATDRRQQDVEDLFVRRREVDVPAPDPFRAPLGERVDHRHGLWVVDDHVVVVGLRELRRVLGVVAGEDRLLLVAQRARSALQSVVDRLRDVEELVLAVDDPPLDVEARVRHQRHERVVDLRDATAERGGRHVHDAFALERLGQPLDLVHQPARDQRGVIAQRLVADVDEWQQT